MSNKIVEIIEKRNLEYKTKNELAGRISNILNKAQKKVEKNISDLVDQGYLLSTTKGKIITLNSKGYLRGKITGHSRGFAFFVPDDVNIPDIFIANKNLNNAMHNDIVLLKKIKSRRKSKSGEGVVIKVIERGMKNLVGSVEYIKNKNFCFVKPDNAKFHRDIYVHQKNMKNADNGQKVVVNILNFDSKNPEGEILEVLGDSGSTKTDLLSIIREYDLIEEFDNKVKNALKEIPETIDINKIPNRLDLRKENIFTIDGSDAKDLDDAVSIKFNQDKNLYTLGVHIADVSEYVREKSVLDNEALQRGTSAYFPHLVLPMLPKKISNGICSLHPNVDRLTISVFMDINNKGEVVNYNIKESVINSKLRFNYDEVYKILQGDLKLQRKYKEQVNDLKLMSKLANILEKNRTKRGAIDFDLPESKVKVDEENLKAIDIYKVDRNESHRLIESFMIAANETVAKHMKENKIPAVYRIHENPESEKIEEFQKLVENLGLTLNIKDSENVPPKKLQQFMQEVEEKSNYSDLISKIMLRTMQKAKYDPKSIGHYGLASTDYCHFTSPIRRYPDLVVHRLLKEWLRNKTYNSKGKQNFVKFASKNSSEREVLAEQAEREVIDYFKAQYMEDKIGNEYVGKVSGVTSKGIFIELRNSVEGFLKIENLPGHSYSLDEKRYTIRNNSNSYTIGDPVKVEVVLANATARNVEFELKQ